MTDDRKQIHSAEKFLQSARSVLERIKIMGVRVPPTSRFEMHLKKLEKVFEGDGVITQERTQAHLELSQLIEIGSLLGQVDARDLTAKLNRMMKDSVRPDRISGESPGRDTQFELYLAARFAYAGLTVTLEEPDVRIEDGLLVIGLAAKRPKSFKRLQGRMNEARDQLRKQRNNITHGLVAIEATFLANPETRHNLIPEWSKDLESADSLTDQVFEHAKRIVPSWGKPKEDLHLTTGVLVIGSALYYMGTPPGTVVQTQVLSILLNENGRFVISRLRNAAQRSPELG